MGQHQLLAAREIQFYVIFLKTSFYGTCIVKLATEATAQNDRFVLYPRNSSATRWQSLK